MATVTSLTAARILELASGWEGVTSDQSELRSFISELNVALESNQADLQGLNEVDLPTLRAALADNQIALGDLNDTVIPDLQTSLDARIVDVASRPQSFFADEPPAGTDARALQIDDIWYDTNDGNKQYRWNGTEWNTFQTPVSDLTVTVKQFISSKHQIY